MPKRYLTALEFAEFADLSISTVRRRLKAGQLPAIQSGGPKTLWKIDREIYERQVMKVGEPLSTDEQVPPQNAGETVPLPGPRPRWTSIRIHSV